MFEIKLQETRVYREAKEEGLKQALEEIREKGLQQGIKEGREQAKLELIPRCLAYGISIEEVARILHLTIEEVEQVRLANEQESSTST
jgi:predicted transposase/invertase (TIGR01784 family)